MILDKLLIHSFLISNMDSDINSTWLINYYENQLNKQYFLNYKMVYT